MNTEIIDSRFKKIVIGKSTITKSALAEAVMARMLCTYDDAAEIVDAIFDEMLDAMGEGHSLKLSNFGTFELRDKKARPGRNPRTLVNHEIRARRVVIFTPAPLMREATKELIERVRNAQEAKDDTQE